MDHFDSVAVVNGWEAADKKKWIRARITGRAATAYKRLSADDQSTYDKIIAALKKRFEPECRKELYIAEFQQRRKRRNEDWASFGEDLKTVVEKAYPMLQAEAQELLALNHFLTSIDNPQLAFGVRQRAPTTVDAAVAATLELEGYLQGPCATSTSHVREYAIAAAGSSDGGVARDLLEKVLERLERLEEQVGYTIDTGSGHSQGSGGSRPARRRRGRNNGFISWRCRGEGHISQDCPSAQVEDEGRESPAPEAVNVISSVNVATPVESCGCCFLAQMCNRDVVCQVDTGSRLTVMSDKLESVCDGDLETTDQKLVGVQGTPLSVCGTTRISLDIEEHTYHADVVVTDVMTADIIIGRDFLRKHECSVAFGEDNTASLKLGGGRTCVQLGCPELVKRDESCGVDRTTKKENIKAVRQLTARVSAVGRKNNLKYKKSRDEKTHTELSKQRHKEFGLDSDGQDKEVLVRKLDRRKRVWWRTAVESAVKKEPPDRPAVIEFETNSYGGGGDVRRMNLY